LARCIWQRHGNGQRCACNRPRQRQANGSCPSYG
jgi:hypothetical protein